MNNYTINSQAFNYQIAPASSTLDTISFNGYNMQNNNIIITGVGFGSRDYPERRISRVDRPQSNGAVVNNILLGGQTITMQGFLVADSKADLDDLIDEFKLKLSPKQKKLKWKVRNEIRQLTATVSDLTFGEKDNIYIDFNLSFFSEDSFWTIDDTQSLVLSNTSSNAIVEEIFNENQEIAPRFIIQVLTGSIDSLVCHINNIGLTHDSSITAGDIVIIDSLDQEFLINNVDTDFEGIFPKLSTGVNTITIITTGTFTADILINYSKTIL